MKLGRAEHGRNARVKHRSGSGIHVSALVKSLRGRQILQGLDFDAQPGTVSVIEGANGAGKTTLIRILSTVVLADSGIVTINGFDVRKDAKQVRRSLGVAFVNDRSLYWRIDAVQNLNLFGRLAGLTSSQISDRVPTLIEELDLGRVARERASRMSTGQRQRLMLARALLVDPAVLLLDEPLRGLDEEGMKVTLDLVVRRARAGCTVLMAAPHTDELLQVAHRYYRLVEGRLTEHSAPGPLAPMGPSAQELRSFPTVFDVETS